MLGGRVVLEDEATIIGQTRYNAVYFIDDVPLVEVAGDLEVGENNAWRFELGSVGITGTIRARVPHASIDFQGVASMLDLDQASIVAEAGRSLSITVNGEVSELQLATAAHISRAAVRWPENSVCPTGQSSLPALRQVREQLRVT